MHSMDNQQQDPSAMMGNLVQLQQMQRLNAARPALIAGLTGGGQGGQNAMGLPNIDPNVLNAMSNDQLQKFYSDQVAVHTRRKPNCATTSSRAVTRRPLLCLTSPKI